MNFRNISAWCIRNPVPPIVLFIALSLLGALAFRSMQVTLEPDIDFPAAQISIVQPGAAPTELETQVAQKVEAAVRNITGVDEINTSVREGSVNMFVQFDIGTPVDRAVNDVRDAISNIRSDLPDGILEPQVNRVNNTEEEIVIYSVEAFDMTLEELSWYVDNIVGKRLRSLGGVGKVERNGGVSREIRVNLDPARMQSYGVTASQINAQLRQTNLNAAGGRTQIAGSEQSVRVLGNAKNALELGQTEISLGGGKFVKLASIADVRDAFAEQRSLAFMDGRQVLSFSIYRAKGASDVSVYNLVKGELAKLERENAKVKFRQLFTTVDMTQEMYDSAIVAMLEGALLAVAVVFLFLRDWRATFISALAIPMSAIPAFWFMDIAGINLNMFSLLALSLVAGVLVDDAIVEIENIVRHMRMGKSAYQASIDAADEIGLAVLATTMSIVAVFLPVGIMPGISGQFFRNFGLTVVFAVLVSLAVARMITPMIAAYFLKAHGEESHGEGPLMDKYMTVLRWTLLHRRWAMAGGLAAFLLTGVMFATRPFTMFPDEDNDYSRIRMELVPGTTLDQTKAVVDQVQAMLTAEAPIVDAAYANITPGLAWLRLTLKEDREQTSIDFEKQWGPRLANIADARVTFMSQTQGGPGGGRDITITLGGDDPVVLMQTANRIASEMKGLKELTAPRVMGDMQRPEIVLKPRMDLAASLGVTTQALSQTIRIATLGDIDQNSGKFSLSDRQIPIRVALEQRSRESLATLENLPVPTSSGGTVPLKSVADISFGAGPVTVQRTNQFRRISIGADLAVNPDTGKSFVSSEAQRKIDALPSMSTLPQGVKKLILGQSKWQAEMFNNFVMAVVSGVLLVFAVLILLYHRIVPPFVNMGSLVLAPLGGVIALALAGMPTSMPVLIGVLMLLGIVAKNSILLIDFALEEIDKGKDKFEAIMEAGHKRAQPIVMTTVAMVAGMIPTALSLGADGSARQPMSITVIGGLIVSTILTLVIVPAAFSLALGVEQRFGPWLRFWLTNHGEEEMERPPSPLPRWIRRRFGSREAPHPAE